MKAYRVIDEKYGESLVVYADDADQAKKSALEDFVFDDLLEEELTVERAEELDLCNGDSVVIEVRPEYARGETIKFRALIYGLNGERQ